MQLTTNEFKEKYLQHLHNRFTYYNNIIVLQVFQYLYNIYGNITELELLENQEKMKTLQNQNELIKAVFYQIESAVEFTQYDNVPFTNTQVLNIVYYIMAQAKIFKEAYKEWKNKADNDKTQPKFK